jgi:hypothetical protein
VCKLEAFACLYCFLSVWQVAPHGRKASLGLITQGLRVTPRLTRAVLSALLSCRGTLVCGRVRARRGDARRGRTVEKKLQCAGLQCLRVWLSPTSGTAVVCYRVGERSRVRGVCALRQGLSGPRLSGRMFIGFQGNIFYHHVSEMEKILTPGLLGRNTQV